MWSAKPYTVALTLLAQLAMFPVAQAQETQEVQAPEYVNAPPSALRPSKANQCNGNMACEKYDALHSLHNGRRVVKLNQLYGYVDGNGFEIVAPQYLRAEPFQESGYALVTRRHGKKHTRSGLIDRSGKVVIPLEYTSLGQCQDNRIGVSLKDKGGFLDCQGQEIVPLQYKRLLSFNEGIGGYYDEKGLVYIGPNGQPRFGETRFDRGGNFRNGRALVQKGGDWHFIDKTGKPVTGALKIDGSGTYENGLYSVKRNGFLGRMNNQGQWVIPPEYDRLRYQNLHENTMMIIAKKGKRWGLLDISGNPILPVKFKDIDAYGFLDDYGVGEPLIRVRDDNDVLYHYNRRGERIEPRLSSARHFSSQNGGWVFRAR